MCHWSGLLDIVQDSHDFKRMLMSVPMMTMADFAAAFKIFTDASKEAVNGGSDGLMYVEHVVAYASQAPAQAEKRWGTFDRVLCAVAWAIQEFLDTMSD